MIELSTKQKNKGAGHLCGSAAHLRLSFYICKRSRFTDDAARIKSVKLAQTKVLIRCVITMQLIWAF